MRPVDACCQHPVGQGLYGPPLVPTSFCQPEFESATAEHSATVTACMSLDAQSPTAVMLPGSRCGPPVYVHVDGDGGGGEGDGGGGEGGGGGGLLSRESPESTSQPQMRDA